MTCPPSNGVDQGSGDAAFSRMFGSAPQVVADAPGRVNLLGEHTDYNDGFVLPTPMPHRTRVDAARRAGIVEAYAERFDERLVREPEEPPDRTWLDYVVGCIRALADEGVRVPGAAFYIHRGVPVDAGLASSAALEVAVLRALRALYEFPLDDMRLAQVAHRAEVEYVGVRCGIMDQMVASLGRDDEALFLDARSLRSMGIQIPPGECFTVVNSGVARRLAEAGYNQRRSECEAAAARLGVRSLRDLHLDDLGRITGLPDPLNRRARHVVTENARALAGAEALRANDAGAFGRLMSESHRSLRDDYDVSLPELDHLVEEAMRHGALGARLTGAGFGGCIVVLHGQADGRAIEEGARAVCPAATFHPVQIRSGLNADPHPV